jgi:hypothetical protein
MDLDDWIDCYARAWETADPELITSLFTDDAGYRSSTFREPSRGHDEIRAFGVSHGRYQRSMKPLSMASTVSRSRRVAAMP